MNVPLRIISFIYIVLGLVLLPFYQYQINPDGVSYLSIAQKFAAGNFYDAINGYWGLLYPLLLSPLLSLPLTPLVATKLFALATGLILLPIFYSLLGLFGIKENLKRLMVAVLILPVLYFGYSVITPDLLLTVIIIAYLRIVFDSGYLYSYKLITLSAILGGLAYLTKQYALPFFLIHFMLINIIFFLAKKANLKNTVTNLGLGLAVFCLITGMWSAALTYKYGHFTLGTSGQYNTAIAGPLYKNTHPSDTNVLISPPNSTAYSIWEDPGKITVTAWNPLASLADLKYQFFLIRENLSRIILFWELFSVLSIWIIVQSALNLIRSAKESRKEINLRSFLILGTIFLYTLGYSLVVVQERYLWVTFILIFLMGAFLLDNTFPDIRNKLAQNLLILCFAVSFIVTPTFYLMKNLNIDREYFQKGQILKQLGISNAKIASNIMGPPTLLLAFHSGNQYFGQTGNYEDSEKLVKLLREHKIDYYLVWEDSSNNPKIDSFLDEVSANRLEGITIYSALLAN